MAAIDDFLAWLACPVCGELLERTEDGLSCESGHTADVARQGYANLLGPKGATHTADDRQMLAARTRILGVGLFDPVGDELREILRSLPDADDPGPVLDLGTGTGFYLDRALEELPGHLGLGLDNSKFAARRAARCHPRAGAIVADIWAGIPVQDRSISVLLDVFAPRNGPEIERVLAEEGVAVVVVAGPEHLAGVPSEFGMITVDPDKRERLARKMEALEPAGPPRSIEWPMALSPGEVRDLVAMGPGAGRVDEQGLDRAVAALPDRTDVKGQTEIHVYTRRDR